MMTGYVARAGLLLCGILAVCLTGRLTAAEYQLCWGDVHTHTNLSDGTGTLDELLTRARDVAWLDSPGHPERRGRARQSLARLV